MAAQPRVPDLLKEIDRLKAIIAELKTSKPYGLVWEDKPEQFEADAENAVPVLKAKGGKFKPIELDPNADHNVLIEGDNYHALSVLSYTHRGKIDVIYIDPPYNTGAHDWKYNNDYVDETDIYRHSKWISMMHKRLALAKTLLRPNGVLVVTIDDYELFSILGILEGLGATTLGRAAICIKPEGRRQSQYFMEAHEYALFVTWGAPKLRGLNVDFGLDFPETDTLSKFRWEGLMRRDAGREDRGSAYWYPFYVNAVADIRVKPAIGYRAVWPINTKGIERVWLWDKQRATENLSQLKATVRADAITIYYKRREQGRIKPTSFWYGSKYNANAYGTRLLDAILPSTTFDYPKSLYSVLDCIDLFLAPDGTALDFFAGSGTTAHAVLELNKDGGNRRFILCTNNENNICEEVTFERIKRVMKGYTTPAHNKVHGLGGNLVYLKTDFVKKELSVGLSDEAKLKLSHRANLLLSLRENTFTPVDATDHYEITCSPTKITAVYFREDKSEFEPMLDKLLKIAGDKRVTVYIFAWEKGAYKTGIAGYPFEFQDIPEPIVEVYQSIGY